ncbi:hypothetical protein J6590_106020 [Homalodisca vitripennis]|nr:hypothetical protein J6590_106020 [Homalodisca vitripennis]
MFGSTDIETDARRLERAGRQAETRSTLAVRSAYLCDLPARLTDNDDYRYTRVPYASPGLGDRKLRRERVGAELSSTNKSRKFDWSEPSSSDKP